MDVLRRILVVDDEEDLTWSIAKSLEKHDKTFEVICVNNGDRALAYLAASHVDLVITDVRMPGRDGWALLRDIERDYPRTRVIIMTAHGSEELRRQYALHEAPLYYYLEKPFELQDLRKLICAALEVSEWAEDKNHFGSLDLEKGNFATDSPGASNQGLMPAGWPNLLHPKLIE
ncbi:MAG: response regulator [candidate division KSB1 bacterium]|nr:response regulator [candidate division KSB1 bacterium]MDZ7367982.1 response regulator [candidate division KSB1 bacterium]MDZ7405605.1 response regulator [candidate division KSB1 bacterium]